MQPIFFENTLNFIRCWSFLFCECELGWGIESLSLLRNLVGVWSLYIKIVIIIMPNTNDNSLLFFLKSWGWDNYVFFLVLFWFRRGRWWYLHGFFDNWLRERLSLRFRLLLGLKLTAFFLIDLEAVNCGLKEWHYFCIRKQLEFWTYIWVRLLLKENNYHQ